MQIKYHPLFLLVLFVSSLLSAQGLRVDIGRGNYPVERFHVVQNEVTKKINKSDFHKSYNNAYNNLFMYNTFYDDYHFFHLYKRESLAPYDRKNIVLMPKQKIVATKLNGVITYIPYKDFFKNGGFFKTDETKIIYGQKAVKYRMTPSFLDIDIWLADAQDKNRFTDLLHELGLLDALPKNKKIIAFTYNTMEFDVEMLRWREERKDWLDNEFNQLMKVSEGVEKEREACQEKNTFKLIETSSTLDIPKNITLPYKSIYASSLTSYYPQKKIDKNQATAYWSDTLPCYLQLYDVTDTKGEKYIYFKDKGLQFTGIVTKNTFEVQKAEVQKHEACSDFGVPILLQKETRNGREIKTYMTFDKSSATLFILEIDEKSTMDTTHLFDEYKLPKGEVISSKIYGVYFNYLLELKTIKESKKITIDVKN